MRLLLLFFKLFEFFHQSVFQFFLSGSHSFNVLCLRKTLSQNHDKSRIFVDYINIFNRIYIRYRKRPGSLDKHILEDRDL